MPTYSFTFPVSRGGLVCGYCGELLDRDSRQCTDALCALDRDPTCQPQWSDEAVELEVRVTATVVGLEVDSYETTIDGRWFDLTFPENGAAFERLAQEISDDT